MRPSRIRNLATFVVLAAFAVFAAQQTTNKPAVTPKDTTSSHTTTTPKQESKAPDKQILFFMNPNGRPCQLQLSILDNMKDKLNGLATVTYIKTTEPADESKFYQYGIRGLPSLIIADKAGKELKRLPPGVKDETTILNALDTK